MSYTGDGVLAAFGVRGVRCLQRVRPVAAPDRVYWHVTTRSTNPFLACRIVRGELSTKMAKCDFKTTFCSLPAAQAASGSLPHDEWSPKVGERRSSTWISIAPVPRHLSYPAVLGLQRTLPQKLR